MIEGSGSIEQILAYPLNICQNGYTVTFSEESIQGLSIRIQIASLMTIYSNDNSFNIVNIILLQRNKRGILAIKHYSYNERVLLVIT
jgi:hypothetical protein